MSVCGVFFFKQKTAYELRISDWSSDVCSADLAVLRRDRRRRGALRVELPAAAARDPARRGRGQPPARGGPVRAGVPRRAAAAARGPPPRPTTDRKSVV